MQEIAWSHIGETHEILEIVVTTSWNHIILLVDLHALHEKLEHVFWHLRIVNKPNRFPFFALP